MVRHVENVKRSCKRIENELEHAMYVYSVCFIIVFCRWEFYRIWMCYNCRQLNKRLVDESLIRQITSASGVSPKSIVIIFNVFPRICDFIHQSMLVKSFIFSGLPVTRILV